MTHDAIRAYAAAVVGCPIAAVTAVARFERGDRHAVHRVHAAGRDVVVRVSLAADDVEREKAATEALVLASLGGTVAPRLLDHRLDNEWFDAPVMCMELVAGEARELTSVAPGDVERLGAVVATLHDRPVAGLAPRFGGACTLGPYVDERLALNESYRPRLRRSLPGRSDRRVERAFELVAAAVGQARRHDRFRPDEPLVLLHGDIGAGNVLWAPAPVLIDWEYARLGDPADEIAYTLGEHGLDETRRRAFWAGYRGASARAPEHLDDLAERARWWEPLTRLGSALWWFERWSRRVAADAGGGADPHAPKPAGHYLEEAVLRLDRFDEAVARWDAG